MRRGKRNRCSLCPLAYCFPTSEQKIHPDTLVVDFQMVARFSRPMSTRVKVRNRNCAVLNLVGDYLVLDHCGRRENRYIAEAKTRKGTRARHGSDARLDGGAISELVEQLRTLWNRAPHLTRFFRAILWTFHEYHA